MNTEEDKTEGIIPQQFSVFIASLWFKSTFHPVTKRIVPLAVACAFLWFTTPLSAKEIHSNGLGGGRWSDASTWKGGAVPTAEDDAILSARDTVVFDRDDTDKPTCKQLLLDANSNLAFQAGQGRRVLSVDGLVEAYGSIKMHAPGLTDVMELRLVATNATERVFKLQRGGSLFLVGRANLPEGKRNVAIISPIAPGEKTPAPAELTAVARTMVDLQNAQFDNVHVGITGIDNTGDKPNERCNVIGNRFTAFGRLSLANCDTPAIVRNEFRAQKSAMVRPSALAVNSCQLADIRENRIYGAYAIGISLSAGECSVSGNLIEDCAAGISWHTGNAMLKQNTIRNCNTGMSLRTLTGSAEDTLIDRAVTAVSLAAAKVQLTNITVTNAVTNKVLSLISSSLTMLNCNIRPEQVTMTPSSAKPRIVRGEEPLEVFEFLVVRVKGEFPRRTHVEVITAKPEAPLAPGATDLNIRNSPVALRVDGWTPLPNTLTPLVVKSWRMDENGEVVPAPEYILNVVAPATEPGTKPRVLKSVPLTPSHTWNRRRPNDPEPTVEIQLP
ncbi:MAG: right-handed parallel beta-helix repeat-containing protein [Limisphaerales bacterium]